MILPSGRVLIIGFLTAELRSACSRSYLRVSRIRSFHCWRINSSETRHFATNAGGWCPCAELQFVRVYFLGLAKVFCHRQVKTGSQPASNCDVTLHCRETCPPYQFARDRSANCSSWRTASSLRTFCRLNKRDSSRILDWDSAFGCFSCVVERTLRIGSRRIQPGRIIRGTFDDAK